MSSHINQRENIYQPESYYPLQCCSMNKVVPVPLQVIKSRKLSPHSKVLYFLILYYAWIDEYKSLSQEDMAEELGTTRQTISHHLKELRECKLITWDQSGLGETNTYKILPIPDAI